MTKSAATRETTTIPPGDELDQYLATMSARRQFMGAAGNMGWQLALTVLVPVFVGVKLDSHFHASPSYTLAALFIAAGAASLVVWKTIKRVSKQTDSPSIVESKTKEEKA